MKIVYLIITIQFVALSNIKPHAQSFSKGQHAPVQPHQIITDNYISVALKDGNKSLVNFNLFDFSNPYTYIQSVQDENEKTYQILYQTDFGGNVTYLSYSNNLDEFFLCSEKPMFGFLSCIDAVNTFDFPTENIERAVNCIIERLNCCKK